MRKLAAGVGGAFALLAMMVFQPWDRLNCDPSNCSMYNGWGGAHGLWVLLPVLLYIAFPLVVVGIIQVSVLGIRDSSRPHDLAVRAALGETGGSAVRAAASRGLRDGALVVGGAYVVSGVTQVIILVQSGWPLSTDAYMWTGRLVVALSTIGTLVLAHVIDAARPHRTPVERLYEDAKPVESGRGRRRLGVALAVVTALASGVVAGIALAYDLAPSFYVSNTIGIAVAVAIVAMLALALFVLIPASQAAVPAVLTWVAARVPRPAGSIVAARAGTVTRAGGRLVVVLGSFGYLLGAAASVDTSTQLSPTYLGFRTFGSDIDAEAFADELRAVDGVAGVIMPQTRDIGDASGNPGYLFAVDPNEVRQYDPALAQILTEHPSAIAQNLWNGSGHLHEGSDPNWGFIPTGIVPIVTCCETFTSASAGMVPSADAVTYLIYSTDPALNDEVTQAAWDLSPYGPGEDSWESSGQTASSNGNSMWLVNLAYWAFLALLLGTPMVALGVGVARARRRDDATLAAMGATRVALRRALVVETVTITAFAMVVGTGLGGITRFVITLIQRARSSLTGVITDSYLATAFGSVAWVVLLCAVLITVSVVGITVWITAVTRRTHTPVEDLQYSTVGGVR
ncbi:FtsX-like permease family protein [Demequina sp.]|uniref:FtsX-like permease family protein n=1 Tax=Demequina sp. TaxID=2050685 RepID=UPI003D0F195D